MAVKGAVRWAERASPTAPEMEISERAVSMASAIGESAGPAPSGSFNWAENPSATVLWIFESASELMMLPMMKVSPSQMPEMNS